MTYYNEHDIADAVRRLEPLPNAGQGARTLERLVDWTNANSDGWPYWAKPRNAARRLVELLAGLDRWDPVDCSAEDLALALRPLKAFLTRQGVDHAEILADPCERCAGTGMLWGEEHGPRGTRACPVCQPPPLPEQWSAMRAASAAANAAAAGAPPAEVLEVAERWPNLGGGVMG